MPSSTPEHSQKKLLNNILNNDTVFRNPWWQQSPLAIDPIIIEQAQTHQNSLTKPQGSLGDIEDIAIRMAGIQQKTMPSIDNVGVYVFAADHGIMEEGVSAFPQAVTAEMLKNFVSGGAAISVLSKSLNADLVVVNVGSLADENDLPSVVHRVVNKSSGNIAKEPAMDQQQFEQAMTVGSEMAENARFHHQHLFVGGEMGIGNTSVASALICHFTENNAASIVGPGTGLDNAGILHKQQIVDQAIATHQASIHCLEDALIRLGGFEIVALVGAYIRAAQLGIAVLVDGFICSAAALAATRLNPEVAPYLFYCHQSAEPGHQAALTALNAKPLLNMRLRLGEGSGAALAVPLFKHAVALHNNMATFAEANISDTTTSHQDA
ncbi:MAG: nicotinate-nucleotide--dimethylbenzimidazole phosphoribosyltransferase [Pseudomonadales bacterium]|nr:nicotinate-nucleotide--dimethylbenzimidazole phosphoribosyltransferase [Pseudomonadales bacterium]